LPSTSIIRSFVGGACGASVAGSVNVSVADTAAQYDNWASTHGLGYARAVPVRATKRGDERTPLAGEYDVLICGASFAGLAVARELAGSDARVLVVDRYEIGERQTSACAAPTEWLENLGLADSMRQTFRELVIHTPHTTVRMELPWTFSTFDYPELCRLLWEQSGDAEFETAKVERRRQTPDGGRQIAIETDRGTLSAPLVVDALGWKRVLAGNAFQPPEAPLSRGLEVHPWGTSEELEIWIDRDYVPAGYGWSFPARDEVRVGVGSFDPRHHVKEPTVRLAADLERDAVRYQGNWIPHRLRPAAADSIFFTGDSAGHCLPLTAEGIRTAFYFGIACGAELRRVVEGTATRDAALRRYAHFSATHRWKFEAMLRTQRLVPRVPPRLLALALRGMSTDAFVSWSFGHYFDIAPPSFAREHAPPPAGREALRAAA
jgi:menaquinone-9 beta-reductase